MKIPLLNGIPLDQIPVRAEDTGIPVSRLAYHVLRNELEDPIGAWADRDTLVVLPDCRLRDLQLRLGVEPWPELHEFFVVPILATNQGA